MVLKKNLKNGFKLGARAHEERNTVASVKEHREDGHTLEEESEDEDAIETRADNYEAPDGGWGWMVTVGLILVFVTTIGPSASFTIVFGDFLEETDQAGSVMTMLNSLFNISYSLAGLVTNPLLKQFSMRSIGIIGAILFTVPNVMMAFITHVVEMAVIFFLQGIGLGLIYTICNTNFNAYFDKKRSTVMGISQVIVGLGGIVYPIVIELMMEEYGFRGTAAIIGALSLHCITAMALMRPPLIWEAMFRKAQSIKIQVNTEASDESKKPLVALQSAPLPREVEILKNGEKWISCRSLHEDDRTKAPDLAPDVRVASASDVENRVSRERSKSLLVSSWQDWPRSRKNALLAGFSSSSLTNLRVQPGTETLNNAVLQLRTPAAAIVEDEQDSALVEVINDKTPRIFRIRSRRLIDSLIDFSLLKNRSFLSMCLGISFVFTSDFTFASFLPMMITSRGFTKADAALAITVSASAELVSRICLAVFTIYFDVRPKLIFFFAMIAMTLAKIGYLYLEDTFVGTIVMVAAIGAARSWLLVPQPLVVVENISADQFAAAYGVYAIVSGLISVIFGPLAGLIKDWTDSFVVCQIALLLMNALFIVPWAIEIGFSKKKTESAT